MKFQTGFIGVGALIAILLGLAVLSGAAYYAVHQNVTPVLSTVPPDITTTTTVISSPTFDNLSTNYELQEKEMDTEPQSNIETERVSDYISHGCVSDSILYEVGDSRSCINNPEQGQKCSAWANFICSEEGKWTLAKYDAVTGHPVTLLCEKRHSPPKAMCVKVVAAADGPIYGFLTLYNSCEVEVRQRSGGILLHEGPCAPEDKGSYTNTASNTMCYSNGTRFQDGIERLCITRTAKEENPKWQCVVDGTYVCRDGTWIAQWE